jgi:lysophospholipase L1-like esterase
MRARGRLLSCLVTMVIALAGFVTAGALPAAAAPSTVEYVALGDSYAAGTAIHSDCPSPDGYPALLDSESIRISLTANAACSGATTSDVLGQLSALKSDTRLVTVTVGAADLGLSAVLAACSNLSTPQMVQECQGQINRALALLRDCPEDEDPLILDCSLTPLYAKVAEKARGARIVVTGYPLLFDPSVANNFPFRDINEATTRLNSLIERAVTATQDTYANIYYVDVTKEFARHGIVDPRSCTDDASDFIHRLSLLPTCDPRPDPEAFHPTANGYKAYADAISAVLPAGWLDKP